MQERSSKYIIAELNPRAKMLPGKVEINGDWDGGPICIPRPRVDDRTPEGWLQFGLEMAGLGVDEDAVEDYRISKTS